MADVHMPSADALGDALENSGAELAPGLTSAELTRIEQRFGFSFAPDHWLMLSIALPLSGSKWPDWREGTEVDLRERLRRPLEGLLFDVQHNNYWVQEWGTRPARTRAALRRAEKHFALVAPVIPLYSHRYLPSDPPLPGNPVLSIYQRDVVYYGANLLDWFDREFHRSRRFPVGATRRIPFWTAAIECE
jgi:hypothetical protein